MNTFAPEALQPIFDHFDPDASMRAELQGVDGIAVDDFLSVTATTRSDAAIAAVAELLQSEAVSGADVVLADCLEAGIASFGLAAALGLSIERAQAIQSMVARRSDAVVQSIMTTARSQNAELFNELGKPVAIDGYVEVSRQTAYVAHAYSGTDPNDRKNGSIERRRNKLPHWTHVESVSFFSRSAIKAVRPQLPLNKQGSVQIVTGSHDGSEATNDPDSEHWYYHPGFVSWRVVRGLAQESAADGPKHVADAARDMTRTRGINGGRMVYQDGYIVRGISHLRLLSGVLDRNRGRTSRLFIVGKGADQQHNKIDGGLPSNLEDYIASQKLMLTAAGNCWEADYLKEVMCYGIDMSVANLANMLELPTDSSYQDVIDRAPLLDAMSLNGAEETAQTFESITGLPISRRLVRM